jgi:hypothetical protein
MSALYRLARKPASLAITALIGLLPAAHSQALDKHFMAFKYTQFTPISNEDSVFPEGSIDFDSTAFTELTYASPTSKPFSIEVSALLDAEQKVDQLKALFNWGGIMLVTSSGTIKGSFSETDKARLPGNQDPDALFQTLLPEEQSFEGKSQFIALGVERYGDRYVGLGYHRVVAPMLLSVDTNQNPTFGFNSRTGEFENYNEELPVSSGGCRGHTGNLWFVGENRHAENQLQRSRKNQSSRHGLFPVVGCIAGCVHLHPRRSGRDRLRKRH